MTREGKELNHAEATNYYNHELKMMKSDLCLAQSLQGDKWLVRHAASQILALECPVFLCWWTSQINKIYNIIWVNYNISGT